MSKRKRRFSAEFKAEVVLTVLTGEKSQAEVCRGHELSTPQFGNWKCQFFENTAYAFEKPQNNKKAEQIAELERIVGRCGRVQAPHPLVINSHISLNFRFVGI